MRSAFLVAVALLVACAKQQLPPEPSPVAQLSPEQEARCRTVSDSVFANVPLEQLPEAGRATKRPSSRDLPRVPMSVPPGMPVRVAFLVRPDGAVDTTTVTITGTDDARFRHDAMRMASRLTFTPAQIEGCPVWSHEAMISVRGPVVREHP